MELDLGISRQSLAKPYIGVSILDVSEEAQAYGIPVGAAVQGVTEGAPAQKAGLQVNDVITAVNGQAITGSSDLVEFVGNCEPGDELTLTVYRMGQTLELKLTVEEQISSATAQQAQTQSQNQFQNMFPGGW